MIKTMFEKIEDIGVTKGKAEGRAEGKAEMVLKILRGKFGKVPKEIEKAISQMTDPIALDSWAVHAATCQSMKEFAEGL